MPHEWENESLNHPTVPDTFNPDTITNTLLDRRTEWFLAHLRFREGSPVLAFEIDQVKMRNIVYELLGKGRTTHTEQAVNEAIASAVASVPVEAPLSFQQRIALEPDQMETLFDFVRAGQRYEFDELAKAFGVRETDLQELWDGLVLRLKRSKKRQTQQTEEPVHREDQS